MFNTIPIGSNGGEVQVEYRLVEAEYVIYSIHCIVGLDLFPSTGLRMSVYSGDLIKLNAVGHYFVDQGKQLNLKDAIMSKLRELPVS